MRTRVWSFCGRAARRSRRTTRLAEFRPGYAELALLADRESDGTALVELGNQHLVFKHYGGIRLEEHAGSSTLHHLIGRFGGRSEVNGQAGITLSGADAEAGVVGDSEDSGDSGKTTTRRVILRPLSQLFVPAGTVP